MIYYLLKCGNSFHATVQKYKPSDRCLSAKLVPTCGQRVPRGQRDGSLRQYSRISRPDVVVSIQVMYEAQMFHEGKNNLLLRL
jgi:hypothetical protein